MNKNYADHPSDCNCAICFEYRGELIDTLRAEIDDFKQEADAADRGRKLLDKARAHWMVRAENAEAHNKVLRDVVSETETWLLMMGYTEHDALLSLIQEALKENQP